MRSFFFLLFVTMSFCVADLVNANSIVVVGPPQSTNRSPMPEVLLAQERGPCERRQACRNSCDALLPQDRAECRRQCDSLHQCRIPPR